MELYELLKGIIADDIAIEHEKQAFSIILSQNILGELEGTSCTECLLLLRIGDFDVVLRLEWLERVLDVMRLIVDGDDHFHDSNLGKRL
jgi:hypothetical protein